MCRGDAEPLVKQTSIELWIQHSLGTVWHLWGSPKENLRERAIVVTAGGSDCFSVSLLLEAGTIDSGRKEVVKSKGESAGPGRRLPAAWRERKCRKEGTTGCVTRRTQ